MKKIFAALLALVASAAFGTTTVPVQLLNPIGSSSGQAIVSTGVATAPAWGGIGVNGIAAIAANTVLANATASSASPTAFTMPSCSTSASALNWTSGTGFTCNTAVNAAQLGGQTFTSPTITTPTINGVTNASAAAAGSIGEVIANTPASTACPATGASANLTSISLTAGDWYVYGSVAYLAGASTTLSNLVGGASTTSVTLPGAPFYAQVNATLTANSNNVFAIPTQIINVSTTTTLYLVGQVTYASGTCNYVASLQAMRYH